MAITPLVADDSQEPRRRARIRVYSQEAELTPVMTPVMENREAEQALERKLRSEVSAPTSLASPEFVMPLAPAFHQPNTEAEESDEEEDRWITATNFLLDEDMIDQEDALMKAEEQSQEAAELEITNWEGLERSMVEEALTQKEPEMDEEELEDYFSREETQEKPESGGLEMAEIAPVEDLQQMPDSLHGRSEMVSEPVGFVPILQSPRQMNGEVSRPGFQRNPELNLSRSQGMLNDLKEKWAKPADAPGIPEPRIEASAPALPRESLLSRPSLQPVSGGLGAFGGGNSAISSRPSVLPSITAPPRPQPDAPRPQPSMLQNDSHRIRSSLGNTPGF